MRVAEADPVRKFSPQVDMLSLKQTNCLAVTAIIFAMVFFCEQYRPRRGNDYRCKNQSGFETCYSQMQGPG